jgi:hypothetical protein
LNSFPAGNSDYLFNIDLPNLSILDIDAVATAELLVIPHIEKDGSPPVMNAETTCFSLKGVNHELDP